LTTVGSFEAKTHLPALLDRVAAGEEITITRRGVPVARLVPLASRASKEEIAAAMRRIDERSRGVTLGGLDIKALINEGRP
jgi:prevent-host-death family protein